MADQNTDAAVKSRVETLREVLNEQRCLEAQLIAKMARALGSNGMTIDQVVAEIERQAAEAREIFEAQAWMVVAALKHSTKQHAAS